MSESLTARLVTGADARLARGVVAGVGAGLVFLLANMWYADSQGMPPVAPLYDISTIFHFADKPQPSPDNLAVGLVTHLALSAGFGAIFALLAPLANGSAQLAVASAMFGVLLYVFNFQILGRLVFEWFQEGPDQTFELFAHLGYGLLLAPFTLGYARSRQAPAAAPRGLAAAAR